MRRDGFRCISARSSRLPAGYLGGLALALRCAKWNLLEAARNLRYFGEAVAAGQWIMRQGAPHIHTHFASLTALLIERIFRIPFSMTVHGDDEFIDPSGFCMEEKVRASRLVIGISRYGCSQIMRFSNTRDWDKVAMVRLGIDPRAFQFAEEKTPTGRFDIICVGRLAKVKGHVLLLRAMCRLLRAHPAVRLTIVGGGPEHENLQRVAAELGIWDAVEFTGGLPNEAVRHRVTQSDCFALPSFAEGVPVVLMEAMALGVACVATRITGVPELIEDEREGLLVPPGDEVALASAIERLMLDPGLADRLRANAQSKVLRDYDLNRNVPELKERLLACIQKAVPRKES